MRSRSRWIPLLLLGILPGCEEPLAQQPHPLVPQFVEPIDDPDGGEVEIPPEFNQFPMLEKYYIEAGFDFSHAFARAYMKYYANRASQDVTLQLYFDGSQILQRTAHSTQHSILPWWRELSTSTTVPVSRNCGHMVLADSRHNVSNELLLPTGWFFFGQAIATDHSSPVQPACPPPPPDPGGGDGGWNNEEDICQICQQWFWVSNGVIVDEWWDCFHDFCGNWET